VALTLELDGAAGAVVSELDNVVKVVVVIGDMLLARSIATMPNLYAVPAYKAAALYDFTASVVAIRLSDEFCADAGPR
jgi:hypothetical protein